LGSRSEGANALVIQPDGKLVVAGRTERLAPDGFSYNDFALVRYRPSGALDGTFGEGGKTTTGWPGPSNDVAHALVRQRDGKLVAGGSAYNYRMGPRGEGMFALARYLPS
jgi:uncharacterized delta-60 repeat protein